MTKSGHPPGGGTAVAEKIRSLRVLSLPRLEYSPQAKTPLPEAMMRGRVATMVASLLGGEGGTGGYTVTTVKRTLQLRMER